MFKTMKKRIKNEKGLTLIELLAVVVILAIVAAIAVPAIGNIINNSRDKAILAEASNVLAAGKLAVTEGACTASGTTGGTCSADQLDPFYDGATTGIAVSYTDSSGNRTYEVTHPKLSDIKNTGKFGTYTDDKITESELTTALQQ
ncbi:prepilin-type N-terminal cleavage/methylation domain-containing protein [Ureibacillus chungkukjangi]|uniref:pilus assembly FimT family protein n=1 Tax=Ureibacillus chungkukjangi TaxID=1202712 RepID=UPI00203D6E48|nr:prepilin-type N-terminal cleavage/methylation domain-containing protein [Ureibacillus chungkukjangi]MCM3386973.1 prepilin-type N-terminal cleavage/methylation domain-containing protein [Ureibacillus chungkukjangi]